MQRRLLQARPSRSPSNCRRLAACRPQRDAGVYPAVSRHAGRVRTWGFRHPMANGITLSGFDALHASRIHNRLPGWTWASVE